MTGLDRVLVKIDVYGDTVLIRKVSYPDTHGVTFVSVSCHLCVCFVWFSCIARVFQFIGDWSILLTVRCFFFKLPSFIGSQGVVNWVIRLFGELMIVQ